MAGVPYTFATATTSIPLSQLDANFNTTLTLGNTSVGLGNTATTIGNLTLSNVTISSGTSNVTQNLANVTGTLAVANGGTGVTTLTSGYIPYGNGTSAFSSSSAFNYASGYLNIGTLRIGPDAGYNWIYQSGSGTVLGLTANGGAITFGQTSSEQMRIDSSGNLLVGTTSASGIITAWQPTASYCTYFRNSNASNPYGTYIEYTGASPNSAGFPFIRANDTSANRFFVYSNGGIANYQANNTNLSDETLKKDIQLAPNYLDKLCQIPVKTFLFNDQTDTDLNLGVIAQDVKAVCPELVGTMDVSPDEKNPNLKLAIYETDLKYAMLKAIQELKAEVDSLKQQIGAK